MSKVKVRVKSAVVDGRGAGEVVEINERSVQSLLSLGYIELLDDTKGTQESREATPESAPEEVVAEPKSTPTSKRKRKQQATEVTEDSTEE